MYKALISDYDNTLVNAPTHKINSKVSYAIKQFKKKGHIFSIATGRPWVGIIKSECDRLNMTDPQILCGGAGIFDPKTDDLLYSQYLPEQAAREITKFFINNNVDPLLQVSDAVYSPNASHKPHLGEGVPFKDIKHVDYSRILQIDISPYVSKLPFEQANKYQTFLSEKYDDCFCVLVHAGNKYGMNVTSRASSKHTGILKFFKLMDLKPEETVGIGDGPNDYPLLTACGYKVAMANAPQELKDIADLVVAPQREDGILEVFDKIFGIKVSN